MPTLYIRDVPAKVYERLRQRARRNRRTLRAEALHLLEQVVAAPAPAAEPPGEDWYERGRRLSQVGPRIPPGWVVRELRKDRAR